MTDIPRRAGRDPPSKNNAGPPGAIRWHDRGNVGRNAEGSVSWNGVRSRTPSRPTRGAPALPDARPAPGLLLDHPDLDLGLHVGVQPDRNPVDAQRLDGLVQV